MSNGDIQWVSSMQLRYLMQCIEHGVVVQAFEMNDFEKNMYQEIRMLREKFSILKLENAKLKDQLRWRPVSEKPEKDQIVIATYLNCYGKRRRVRAVYIRQYEEEAGEDDELCAEYCEERDEWYLKEGWYELIDNWADYSSVAIVEGVVDYWMPMPPAPEGE